MSVFDYQSEYNSPALNRLIAEFGLDAPVDPARLTAEFERDNELDAWVAQCRLHGVRVCTGCGCTDEEACRDEETGKACYWVAPELCSVCAEAAEAAPLVELVSDAQASAFLRSRRIGGAL